MFSRLKALLADREASAVLSCLAKEGRLTASELSARTGIPIPGVCRALNFLEALGLAEFPEDP